MENYLLKGLLEKGYKQKEILNLLLKNLMLDSVQINFNNDKTINYHISVTKYGIRPDGAYVQSKLEKESFELFEDIAKLYIKELNRRTN